LVLERIGAAVDLRAVTDAVAVGIRNVGVGAIGFRLVDVGEPVTVAISACRRRIGRERIGAQVDLFTVAGPVTVRVGDIRIRVIDACLVIVVVPVAVAVRPRRRDPDRTDGKHRGERTTSQNAQYEVRRTALGGSRCQLIV
jgi:hypothetical protein